MLGWIEAVLGERLPSGPFEEVLRDGTILCRSVITVVLKYQILFVFSILFLFFSPFAGNKFRLMNKLKPGAIAKINSSGGQFKMMENINKFQAAIKDYGVPDIDCFQTVDLYERRNIPQVTQCIMALGRTVCSFVISMSQCLLMS